MEDRFARVVEASPTALVLAGPTGRIEMVNRQAELMFGYHREELATRPLEILIPERFRHGHAMLRGHFMTELASRLMGEGRELFGLRKDGTEFPLEIGLSPIDIDGASMVLAGIIDITARRQLDLEKEQQRVELARSNSDLEEFAYVASHDLKAPLRAISHLVEWIGEDIEDRASADTLSQSPVAAWACRAVADAAGRVVELCPHRTGANQLRTGRYRTCGARRRGRVAAAAWFSLSGARGPCRCCAPIARRSSRCCRI